MFPAPSENKEIIRLSPIQSQNKRIRDTLESAIGRFVRYDENPKICHNCSDRNSPEDLKGMIEHRVFEAVPEYLIFNMNGAYVDKETYEEFKSCVSVTLPDILDLTQHMKKPQHVEHMPVQYRLVQVIYHIGESPKFGHYVAGITGFEYDDPTNAGQKLPTDQFLCNDPDVDRWVDPANANALTRDPANVYHADERLKGSEYNAYVVFCERISGSKKDSQDRKKRKGKHCDNVSTRVLRGRK